MGTDVQCFRIPLIFYRIITSFPDRTPFKPMELPCAYSAHFWKELSWARLACMTPPKICMTQRALL
eukprot:3385967-Alexandrium_andersonii.AAC.1